MMTGRQKGVEEIWQVEMKEIRKFSLACKFIRPFTITISTAGKTENQHTDMLGDAWSQG